MEDKQNKQKKDTPSATPTSSGLTNAQQVAPTTHHIDQNTLDDKLNTAKGNTSSTTAVSVDKSNN